MTLEILNAHEDAKRWHQVLALMPYDVRDVHFTPEYGAAQERLGDYTAHLAVYTSPDNWIACQAFIKRPIEWTAFPDNQFCDITAMGYGGPIANDTMPSLAHGEEYQAAWHDWMRSQNVVSEFALLNPAFEAAQGYLISEKRVREKTVVILPVRPEKDMLAMMRRDRRRDARKAALTDECRSIGVATTENESALDEFFDAYRAMCERHKASDRWRLNRAYLAAFRNVSGAVMSIASGRVQTLALFGNDIAYYYLTATAEKIPRGANELVILHLAELARLHGCSWMHLGGGVTSSEHDPLLDFKRSCGGLQVPCYSYRRVIDGQTYNLLADANPGKGNFFPAYRAKEANS